jgi:hypothetical protein
MVRIVFSRFSLVVAVEITIAMGSSSPVECEFLEVGYLLRCLSKMMSRRADISNNR